LAVVEAYAENNGNNIKIVQGITGSRKPTHNPFNINYILKYFYISKNIFYKQKHWQSITINGTRRKGTGYSSVIEKAKQTIKTTLERPKGWSIISSYLINN